MPGGSDAGFDGAVGTAVGPFPVICTTAEDVIGNVRKNLAETQKKTTAPRLAVVATSRRLMQPARTNIIKAAHTLGVTIANIHDREYFANRLYHDSRWRKELLGISGDAPALSSIPPRGRFDSAEVLVGRDAELERLRKSASDLLIVGQPGSGKTHLHQRWAAEDGCLFVACDQLDRVCDEIRLREPSCVVIDDVHMRLPFAEGLRRARVEMRAEFRIHATCWENHQAACRGVLGLGSDDVLHLGLLTRTQIAEVIRSRGVAGPDMLLCLLLDQARGKPGLAVELAEACKQGDVERVWTGEALADHLLHGRRVAGTERERSVLAAFALGGDAGMSLGAVSRSLQLPEVEIRGIVTELDAGGIIEECDDDRLAVYPASLRSLLAKEVFFAGARSLDPRSLLDQCASRAELAHVVMGARQRGARVSIELIDSLVKDSWDPTCWRHFASVDRECAEHILQHHPDRVDQAARGLLGHIPDRTIPRLLDRAAANHRRCNPRSEAHPPEGITEWIVGTDPTDPSHLERRAVLLRAAVDWWKAGPDRSPVMVGRLLALVMAPNFADTAEAPGNGLTYRFRREVFPLEQLRDTAARWPTVRDEMSRLPKGAWKPILETIGWWCFPRGLSRSGEVPPETSQFLRTTGITMLRDVAGLRAADRAVRSWIAATSRRGDLGVGVATDADFEVLFGERDHGADFEQSRARRERAQADLVERLARLPAAKAQEFLRDAERDAREFGTGGGWDRRFVYHRLAPLVDDPVGWFESMVEHEFPSGFVSPFLERVVVSSRRDALRIIDRLLDIPLYESVAEEVALALDPPDEGVTGKAIDRMENPHRDDAFRWSYIRMPSATRLVLLTHKNHSVRACAAVAEWYRDPAKSIDEALRAPWRRAIVESTPDNDHCLKDILISDPALAFEWASRHVPLRESTLDPGDGRLLADVVRVCSPEQRRSLLGLVTASSFSGPVFDALVGGDLAILSEWLRGTGDDHLRSMPFRRLPSRRWIEWAGVALENGVSVEKLGEMSFPIDSVWELAGNGFYEAALKEYESVLSHPDARLHAATKRGREWAREHIAHEQERDRMLDVYGVDGLRRTWRVLPPG